MSARIHVLTHLLNASALGLACHATDASLGVRSASPCSLETSQGVGVVPPTPSGSDAATVATMGGVLGVLALGTCAVDNVSAIWLVTIHADGRTRLSVRNASTGALLGESLVHDDLPPKQLATCSVPSRDGVVDELVHLAWVDLSARLRMRHAVFDLRTSALERVATWVTTAESEILDHALAAWAGPGGARTLISVMTVSGVKGDLIAELAEVASDLGTHAIRASGVRLPVGDSTQVCGQVALRPARDDGWEVLALRSHGGSGHWSHTREVAGVRRALRSFVLRGQVVEATEVVWQHEECGSQDMLLFPDRDGDGLPEIILGAVDYVGPNAPVRLTTIASSNENRTTLRISSHVESEAAVSVSVVPDLDGDSIPDVLVGMDGWRSTGSSGHGDRRDIDGAIGVASTVSGEVVWLRIGDHHRMRLYGSLSVYIPAAEQSAVANGAVVVLAEELQESGEPELRLLRWNIVARSSVMR